VTQLFNLAIFTKKEIMQLLIDEKRMSYRKGYRAGNALLHRWEKKNANPIPSVYGDSLPIKEMPEVTVHIGDVGPVEAGTVTDNLHYT
jgi:hypothetical protein